LDPDQLIQLVEKYSFGPVCSLEIFLPLFTVNSECKFGILQLLIIRFRITDVCCSVVLNSASAKRQSHNAIEKKRKDRLKLDIDDIRRLLPESIVGSKQQVGILYATVFEVTTFFFINFRYQFLST